MNLLKNFLESFKLILGNNVGAAGDANAGVRGQTGTGLDDVAKGASRGIHSKKVARGREILAEASQKVSKIDPLTTRQSVDGVFTLFRKDEQMEVEDKAPGVQDTKYQAYDLTQRALFTQTKSAAVAVDIDDTADMDVDPLNRSMLKFMQSAARKMDHDALRAIAVDTVYEQKPIGIGGADLAVDGLSGAYTDGIAYDAPGLFDLKSFRRINLYSKNSTDGDSGDIEKFVSNDLEDITHIFNLRDVTDQTINCALTNGLRYRLRLDPDFQNVERIFNGNEIAAGSMNGSFMYRGINFTTRISSDVLPRLSNIELQTKRAAGALVAADPKVVLAFDIKKVIEADTKYAASPLVYEGTTQSLLGAQTNANTAGDVLTAKLRLPDGVAATPANTGLDFGDGNAILKVESANLKNDIAWFWTTESLYCGKRADKSFAATADLPTKQHAKQSYWRSNWGYMVLRDEFVLGYVVKGKVIKTT